MPAPVNAPLVPFVTLGGGMTVRLAALNATTGAVDTSVVISQATISVDPDDTDSGGAPEGVNPALLPA